MTIALRASVQPSSSLVHGEFPFSGMDFRAIAAMMLADAGIELPLSKATLVYSRLAKRLRELSLNSFSDYCELVSGESGGDERRRMLSALTTNVTRFYREPHHFDHLKSVVLPPLLAAARQGGRVRLWSAACSSGQEPYSMALTILSLMPDAARYDIKVLATDIDADVLQEGRTGIYRTSALDPLPTGQRDRWFNAKDAGLWTAGPELRDLVSFRQLNLIGEWPMKGRFQAIFCRNVVIYFGDETQARVWDRLFPYLDLNGRLYIGHSERVTGSAAEKLRGDGLTTYRLRQGADA